MISDKPQLFDFIMSSFKQRTLVFSFLCFQSLEDNHKNKMWSLKSARKKFGISDNDQARCAIKDLLRKYGQNGEERPEWQPRLFLDGNRDFTTGNEMMIFVLQEEEAWMTINLQPGNYLGGLAWEVMVSPGRTSEKRLNMNILFKGRSFIGGPIQTVKEEQLLNIFSGLWGYESNGYRK